jgi:hypothetical protein
VPVTPIGARCRRCGEDFHLFEVRDHSGTCPRCGSMLTQEWTATLREDAARADFAQRHLIWALRSLRSLPGNVVVRPHTVLRNIFEEIGWQKDLAQDPEMLREELEELRRFLVEWEMLDPVVAAAQPRRTRRRRLLDAVTGTRRQPVLPLAAHRETLPAGQD